jgi:hypothetical protein
MVTLSYAQVPDNKPVPSVNFPFNTGLTSSGKVNGMISSISDSSEKDKVENEQEIKIKTITTIFLENVD